MKYLIQTGAIIVLAFIAQGVFQLPYWSLMLVAFIVAVSVQGRVGFSCLAGLIAGTLLWGVKATLINEANDGVLASRMVEIFHLGGGDTQLVLITALLGGTIAAIAAATGSSLRNLITPLSVTK